MDTDCALGSWNEDPDDAFAIIYNLLGTRAARSIYSVGGNTTALRAAKNCETLRSWTRSTSQVICGLDPGSELSLRQAGSENPFQVLGLGPLTNIAHWLQQDSQAMKAAWCTLGHVQTSGSLPPLWPMEFNATQDLKAAEFVFSSSLPLTVVPLDVAIKLKVKKEVWQRLDDSILGRNLKSQCWRWRLRNLILKAHSHFPAWDLVSAAMIENPDLGMIETGNLHFFKNGLVLCDPGFKNQTSHQREIAKVQRSVKIVTQIDSSAIWDSFFQRLASFGA